MDYDFIIIGAGIAGASMAYELAAVARVCMVEMEAQPGLHATGRSAALFAPSYGGVEIRALTRASRDFYDHPPADFCTQPLLAQRGCLYIARADQLAQLAQMRAQINASAGEMVPVDAQIAYERVPRLRRGYVAAAAFDADAMDIDVNSLHQGFLRCARTRGATLIVGAKLAQLDLRGGAWAVPLGDSVARAPVIINAAGAWADDVAVLCGAAPLGLKPLRRTALLVDAPPDVDTRSWPAVIDAEERFYFKPDAGRLLLSPADETPDTARDVYPEDLDIAEAVQRMEDVVDFDIKRVVRSWAGLRTFAPDRVPVVGFDARVPGLFWCAGQGGYGIQTAPAMSRTAAALARGGRAPPDVLAQGLRVEALSPARFLQEPSSP
jgi:D-arginine dehydrogenase